MSNNNYFITTPSPHKQKGIATILMVVLIGIALIATSLSVMHSIRSTQEKQVAVHAVTHAQTGLWTGVEAFRRYLETLSTDDLLLLHDNSGFDITLNDNDVPTSAFGNISVKNITVVKATSGNTYNVQATLVNKHTSAQASAAVGVFIEVNRSGSDPIELAAALDFHDDLVAGGQITMTTPSDTYATINVDGSAIFPKINISRMAALNATGAVELDSAVAADKIHSNEHVVLTGSAKAQTIWAQGTVSVSGGASAGVIWADGDVSYTSGTTYVQDSTATKLTIKSRGSITSTTVGTGDGERDTFTAHGDINIDTESGGGQQSGTYRRLESASNVYIRNTNASVTYLEAEGNLYCPMGNWDSNKFTEIHVRGIIAPGCSTALGAANAPNSGVTAADLTVDAPPVAEVPPVTIPKPVIDVWTLKQHANYVFEYDGEHKRVTTYNVNGFTDGAQYYVGNYITTDNKSTDKNSHLCTAVDVNGNCTAPEKDNSLGSMCVSGSIWDECLSYDSLTNTWKIEGKMAPGIYFVDGNLTIRNGVSSASALVTGNAKTDGQVTQSSVNYADYAGVCNATNIHDSRYPEQYPSNLCDRSTNAYKAIDVGNIGIAAGGYKPGDGGFSGGDIFLADNTKVYGMVLAGDYLDTGGGIEVHGFITAAVQGGKIAGQENELSGNTTLNVNTATTNYNPNKMPSMTDGECTGVGCSGAGGEPETAKLLWSKYL